MGTIWKPFSEHNKFFIQNSKIYHHFCTCVETRIPEKVALHLHRVKSHWSEKIEIEVKTNGSPCVLEYPEDNNYAWFHSIKAAEEG